MGEEEESKEKNQRTCRKEQRLCEEDSRFDLDPPGEVFFSGPTQLRGEERKIGAEARPARVSFFFF